MRNFICRLANSTGDKAKRTTDYLIGDKKAKKSGFFTDVYHSYLAGTRGIIMINEPKQQPSDIDLAKLIAHINS